MKIYTQEELNQICITFAGWLDEWGKRFSYGILKEDERKEEDDRDFLGDPTMPYKEWYTIIGKDFQKVVKIYDEEKVIVETRRYLTSMITQFVENFFSDKEQQRYFVAELRKKTLELEREMGIQLDPNYFAKYALAKNHLLRFSRDMVGILGKRGLKLQWRIGKLFSLFFIHEFPVFIKAMFESNLQYIDTFE